MNILIVESDVYLAQKIVSRLLDDGHSCDFVELPNISSLVKDYDVVLLSTSISNSLLKAIIKKYAISSIVLLLVSYISDEAVTNPIKEGAKDYIMKPFLMDELVRKIYHYKECMKIRKELILIKEYLSFTMRDIDIKNIAFPMTFPLMIETNHQSYADKIVFEIANRLDMPIKFVSLNSDSWQKELFNIDNKTILYLTDYHILKRSVKDQLIKQISTKNCIICTFEADNDFNHKKIIFYNEHQSLNNTQIMSINDYVKTVVSTYQTRYPDTEISKKLGISRKSLWEKRKKLNIDKKK